MALYSVRLRRSLLSLSSSLHRNLHCHSSRRISTLLSNPSLSINLEADAQKSKRPSISQLQWFRSFVSSPVSLSTRRQYQGPNDDQEIGPDTILFEGCDYNHWLITIDFPKDDTITDEQKVETYVQTAALVFGSVEEAKKRIYACSTSTYHGFQVECSQETSAKFEGLPGVVFVLPDSYIDPVNKEYGGDKYENGIITYRPPPAQYRQRNQVSRNSDRPPRENYTSGRGPPPQPNYGPPQPRPTQPNYGLPQGSQAPQSYSPTQGPPSQQFYNQPQGPPHPQSHGLPQGPPAQQNHGLPQGPPHQFSHGLPQGPPSQQNHGLPQGPASQQNYGPPSWVPPSPQKYGPPPPAPPSQQHYVPPPQVPFSQQKYGPPPQAPTSQQNYAPPPQGPQSQQYYRLSPPQGPQPQQQYRPQPPQGPQSQQPYRPPPPQGPPHQQNFGLHSSAPQPINESPLRQPNYSMQQAPAQQNYGHMQDVPHQQNFGRQQNHVPEKKYSWQESSSPESQSYGLKQNVPPTTPGGWDRLDGGRRDFPRVDDGYSGPRHFEGQGQSSRSTLGGNPGLDVTQREEAKNYASLNLKIDEMVH